MIFFLQKWATGRFKFSINTLHPVEKKDAKGLGGFPMHLYCYLLCAIAILPQIYIIYLSFRNSKGSLFGVGYSLVNYQSALKKKLVLASSNTLVMGIIALAVIIVIAVVLAYLVVRRNNALNHSLDTIAMLPYIMPGAVIEAGAKVSYAIVGEGCRVGRNAVVGGAPGSVPFEDWGIAVLGPRTSVADGAVIEPKMMLGENGKEVRP